MRSLDRRSFLAGLGRAGAGVATASWLQTIGYAQSRGPARAFLRELPPAADFDRRLFGSFLEHLGRAVYTGVYQPGLPLADARGFRTDVAREIKELGVPTVRYPGGNFVSGYNWLDGVGPKAQRPTVLERAWNSLESNQFGTNEFIDWCAMVGTEPLLGMNFGTGTVEMAVAYVEYCNFARGTRWSDLRRSHGYERPHNVRYWCLGNEMDGPWQIGQLQAREYGRKARDAAQADAGHRSEAAADCMRIERHVHADLPGLGPRSARRVLRPGRRPLASRVLRQHGAMVGQQQRALSGDEPRHGSPHPRSGGGLRLRAGPAALDRSGCGCRSTNGTSGTARAGAQASDGRGAAAPRLLEEVYNLEDALLVGGFVNTLLRNSDRVRIGCLAQLVNVIAPLVTNEKGVLRQSIYYPYAWALRYARGRVLDVRVESETYPISGAGLQPDFARNGDVPFVDLVATIDEPAGQAAVLMLNRDLDGEREVVLEWQDIVPARVLSCETITGPRPESVQHVRRTAACRAAGAGPARGRQPDVVQAAAALVHRRASESQGLKAGWSH